jgi:transcriptional regulator GlxA family with amidase domain
LVFSECTASVVYGMYDLFMSAGQQPFVRLARSRQVEDAVIARCQTWVAEHYQQPAPVAAMLGMSGLPERSFKRRFQRATGMSPLEYVHTLRLEEAKHMLESTDQPVEAIANEVAMRTPVSSAGSSGEGSI